MILLTHIGNPLPEYTIYSFAHLRKFNPHANIQIILDPYIQNESMMYVLKKFNIIVINSNDYRKDPRIVELNENTWIKDKHPLAPPTTYKSQDNFWHLTMERLFYINAHINKYGLTDILHIENDNVLFYDYTIASRYSDGRITTVKRTHNGEDSTLFSVAHIPDGDSMDNLCKYINELISLGESKLQEIYGFDHISEMHLLTVCRNLGMLNTFPIFPQNDEFVFDPFGYAAYLFGTNNFQGPGFYDESDEIGRAIKSGRIKIYSKNRFPYVVFDQQKYKLFNLHMHRKNIECLL